MNAIDAGPAVAAPATDDRCFHCRQALPAEAGTVLVRGRRERVCCSGCGAAARWIEDSGLDDYYRLRTADGNRVGTEALDFSAWDRDEVHREHVARGADGNEITVVVEGMHCAACAWLIDRALSGEEGVRSASVNAVTGRLRLAWDPARTQLSTLLARVAALGYRPHLAGDPAQERARRRERNRMLLRLGLAFLAATQAMMFSEALYLDRGHQMPLATRDFFRWLTLLVCTPVVFYSGMPFLSGLVREWRQHRLGMDTLAGGSILLAYGMSVIETLRGGPNVWFDAAAMFVLFLLTARALEQGARQRAGARLDLLARAQPALAWRWRDHRLEQVPLSALAVGDLINVPADATAPADGVLEDAPAAFNEALLTGEPEPRAKAVGAPVFAGSIAVGTSARVRVTGLGAQTRLSQIQRLVVQAQAQRPALARVADRIAGRFIAAMILVAVLAFGFWWPRGPEQAFAVALAVLVAACPCALSLAVPTALSAAHDAQARRGVLLIGADALERLAQVDTVVFDKTGTLSVGHPECTQVETFDAFDGAQAQAIAAALEQGSRHPLARAFAAPVAQAADAVSVHPGRGVEGRLAGRDYRLGRRAFVLDAGADDGAIWLGRNGVALARFVLHDPLRADATVAVARLRDQGLATELLSGDAAAAVADAAATLGITDARSRLSPEAKLAHLRARQANGRRVLMVGDGINDAPVLAGADVSLAMASGSALAQGAADALVLGERLLAVPEAIAIARRARRILRQNLAWAAVYNAVAVGIAAAGWIHPGLAALGMAGSSLGVTLNALRLVRNPEAR